MLIEIPYGKEMRTIDIPEEKIIGVINPLPGDEIKDLNREVESSLSEPIGSPPLTKLIKPGAKIVIIVDDNTRPTPTRKLLEPILKVLAESGVLREQIRIIFALGAHRKLTEEEKREILGDEIFENYQSEDHEARDRNSLIDLGKTSFQTPVVINKKVYEADLRILTGLIKPHNLAGYSGGGKAILPGVCGLETIKFNHGFKSMAHPSSATGVIEGNPIREDIEELSKLLGPTFLVNVVMDYQKRICRVVSGDLIEAHRAGANFLDQIAKRRVSKPGDICICGTPDPVDVSFYQMLNSVGAPVRLRKPVINPGGTIIVAGRAHECISTGDFYEMLRDHSREELWKMIQSEEGKIQERSALHTFLEADRRYRIVVVSEEKNEKLFKEMGIEFYSDLQRAVDETGKKYESKCNTIVMPYSPYVIPDYE